MSKTLSRLMLWFLDADPLVQEVAQRRPLPIMRNAYAAALRAMADQLEADQPGDDNINPILHPERPEQVLKPKKKRAG